MTRLNYLLNRCVNYSIAIFKSKILEVNQGSSFNFWRAMKDSNPQLPDSKSDTLSN